MNFPSRTFLVLALASALVGTACSSTRTNEVSLNQLTPQAQAATLDNVKNGRIDEIKSKSRKGMKWYEVKYRLNNQDYLLAVDDEGKLIEKDRK